MTVENNPNTTNATSVRRMVNVSRTGFKHTLPAPMRNAWRKGMRERIKVCSSALYSRAFGCFRVGSNTPVLSCGAALFASRPASSSVRSTAPPFAAERNCRIAAMSSSVSAEPSRTEIVSPPINCTFFSCAASPSRVRSAMILPSLSSMMRSA